MMSILSGDADEPSQQMTDEVPQQGTAELSDAGPPGIPELEFPGIPLFSNSRGNSREFSTFNFFNFQNV